MVHYLRLARLLRISPGETSVPSTFRFIRFHNRLESVIERKQRRMAARRKEKVRGGGRKPREAVAAESLWLFSSSALVVFFFRSILQSFPGRYPAQGFCRGSCRRDSSATVRYHIYLPLRCFVFRRPSLTYTWIVASLFELVSDIVLSSSSRCIPLFARRRWRWWRQRRRREQQLVAARSRVPNFEALTKSRAR